MIRVQEALAGIFPPRMYVVTYFHAIRRETQFDNSVISWLFKGPMGSFGRCVCVCFFTCAFYTCMQPRLTFNHQWSHFEVLCKATCAHSCTCEEDDCYQRRWHTISKHLEHTVILQRAKTMMLTWFLSRNWFFFYIFLLLSLVLWPFKRTS